MLFSQIRKWFSSGPLLMEFDRKVLHVRDVKTGKTRSFSASVDIALKDDTCIILNVGATEALQAGVERIWPFDHPRTVIHDFQIAEKLLQHVIRLLHDNSFIRPAPIIILHSLVKWEWGLTQIEKRALLELAYGAGAREAYVWEDHRLTNSEVASGVYKSKSLSREN